jgi:Icc-related predicted phosphoesterase
MRRRIKRLLVAVIVVAVVSTAGFFGGWHLIGLRSFPSLDPYREQYGNDVLLTKLESQDGDRTSFSFSVLGDSRSNVYIGKQVFAAAASDKPAMIFDTGDLIRHGTAEEYLEHHIPLLEAADPIPVFCIPGNHDRGPYRDFAAYHALYGGDRFSFDYGPCRFVGFNASETVRVSGSELRFLDRELSKPGVDYRFVFFHIPPKFFESQIVDDARRGFEWNGQELRELLTRHKVDEVFMGHIHGYASKVIDDVRYTLTAGGGAPFSERLPPEARIFHYVMIHVGPEGLKREVVYLSREEWVRRPE